MTKKQTGEVLSMMIRLFPNSFARGIDPEEFRARRDDLFEVLHGYEYEHVKAAVNALVRTQTFYPAVSELIEATEKERAKTAPSGPDEVREPDGYVYRRTPEGVLECVKRPETPALKDPELIRLMEQKRYEYEKKKQATETGEVQQVMSVR